VAHPLECFHRREAEAFFDRGEGAEVSVTVRLDKPIRTAIADIAYEPDAWTPIEYTDASFDEQIGQWISRAEVAEIPFTAFASRRKADRVPGRLVVRRIPDLDPP
jgi:hypothetical protein